MSKQSKQYESMRQTQTNTFSDGLNMDLHPLTTPNTILTDCVNGTMITYNDNEFVLQNERGNTKINEAKLNEGFIPVGMKEHNGILYIVSYNPESKETEIGTYPSPTKYDEQLSNEWSFTDNKEGIDFKSQKIFTSTDIEHPEITWFQNHEKQMVSGIDKYNLKESHHHIYNLQFFAKSSNGVIEKIDLKNDNTNNDYSFPMSYKSYIGYQYQIPYINHTKLIKKERIWNGENLTIYPRLLTDDSFLNDNLLNETFQLKLYTRYYFSNEQEEKLSLFAFLGYQKYNGNIGVWRNNYTISTSKTTPSNDDSILYEYIKWPISQKEVVGNNYEYYIEPIIFNSHNIFEKETNEQGVYNLLSTDSIAPKISLKGYPGWDEKKSNLTVGGKTYNMLIIEYVPVIECETSGKKNYIFLENQRDKLSIPINEANSNPEWFTEFIYKQIDDTNSLNVTATLDLSNYFSYNDYLTNNLKVGNLSAKMYNISSGKLTTRPSKLNVLSQYKGVDGTPTILNNTKLDANDGKVWTGLVVNGEKLLLTDDNSTECGTGITAKDSNIIRKINNEYTLQQPGTEDIIVSEKCGYTLIDDQIKFNVTIPYESNQIYLFTLTFSISDSELPSAQKIAEYENITISKNDVNVTPNVNEIPEIYQHWKSGEYFLNHDVASFIIVTTNKMLEINNESRMDELSFTDWFDVETISDNLSVYEKKNESLDAFYRLPTLESDDDIESKYWKYLWNYSPFVPVDRSLSEFTPYYRKGYKYIYGVKNTRTEDDLYKYLNFKPINYNVTNYNDDLSLNNDQFVLNIYKKISLQVDEEKSISEPYKNNTKREYLLKYLDLGEIKEKYYKNIRTAGQVVSRAYFNYGVATRIDNRQFLQFKTSFKTTPWSEISDPDIFWGGYPYENINNKDLFILPTHMYWHYIFTKVRRGKTSHGWRSPLCDGYNFLQNMQKQSEDDTYYYYDEFDTIKYPCISQHIARRYPNWQFIPALNETQNDNHKVYGHCIPYNNKGAIIDEPDDQKCYSVVAFTHERNSREQLYKDFYPIAVHLYVNVPKEFEELVKELYFQPNLKSSRNCSDVDNKFINNIDFKNITFEFNFDIKNILNLVDEYNIQSLNNLYGTCQDTIEFKQDPFNLTEPILDENYIKFLGQLVSNDYINLNSFFIGKDELYCNFDNKDKFTKYPFSRCLPIKCDFTENINLINMNGDQPYVEKNSINADDLINKLDNWRFDSKLETIYYISANNEGNKTPCKLNGHDYYVHYNGTWTDLDEESINTLSNYLHPQFINWYKQTT